MNNIVIVNQGGMRYLFAAPIDVKLKKGDKVKCDTCHGVTDGIVWADSLFVDDETAELIGKLTGAKFPLKSVVGKEITSVEMFDKPQQEDKPKFKRDSKVRCISVTDGGSLFMVDKIYEINSRGEITADNGFRFVGGCFDTGVEWLEDHGYAKFEPYTEEQPTFKVGDKAKVVGNTTGHRFKEGAIIEIIVDCLGRGYRARDTDKNGGCWHHCYVVDSDLEPYTEPEQEREKGCEYCNSRFGIAAHHINEAGLQAGTNKIAKFCPMCGRKLKEVQA